MVALGVNVDNELNGFVGLVNARQEQLRRLEEEDEVGGDQEKLRDEILDLRRAIGDKCLEIYKKVLVEEDPDAGAHKLFSVIINAGKMHESYEGRENPFADEIFGIIFRRLLMEVIPRLDEGCRAQIIDLLGQR